MLESGHENPSGFHLAGIVPVACPPSDFGFPWHDTMQPINSNYLAIERAVVECAYAGCETIWVVCNDDMQPLIKERMGDFIEDPYNLAKAAFVRFPTDHRRRIPIFYTPIHPKDRDRRDSLGWSALHGALTAFIISGKISKWLIPSRYYVAFPQGVYNPASIEKDRKAISSSKAFFISHNGKTVRDGEYLGFTMNAKEYKNYVYQLKASCTGGDKNIPLKERWSSRHFKLDKIFKSAMIEESKVKEIDWYYNIDCWGNYCNYMQSPHCGVLKRPSDKMFKRSKYYGVNTEDENSQII